MIPQTAPPSRQPINVLNTLIVDGSTGSPATASICPPGGMSTVTGNQIEEGAATQNPVVIALGEEVPNAIGRMTRKGNLIEGDPHSGGVSGARNNAAAAARMTSTRIYGLPAPEFSKGPAHVSGPPILPTEPAISTADP